MASNIDNAMARFLYAILEQKNLKDIDWNKVARNPILLQEITNGHAARMRYSRFKASILGLEPQRRNRSRKDNSNSKVTKSKKEPKAAKKEKDEQTTIKSDPGAIIKAEAANGSPKVKNEATPVKKEAPRNEFRFTAAGEMSPLTSGLCDTAAQIHFATRLLTPCSDSNELFAPTHAASDTFVSTASPIAANDTMLHHHHHHDATASGFEYTAITSQQQQQQSASPWHPTSPSYSPFQLPYELDNFNNAVAVSGYCDHNQHHSCEGFGIAPSAMMMPGHTNVPVKHEEWDSEFQ